MFRITFLNKFYLQYYSFESLIQDITKLETVLSSTRIKVHLNLLNAKNLLKWEYCPSALSSYSLRCEFSCNLFLFKWFISTWLAYSQWIIDTSIIRRSFSFGDNKGSRSSSRDCTRMYSSSVLFLNADYVRRNYLSIQRSSRIHG